MFYLNHGLVSNNVLMCNYHDSLNHKSMQRGNVFEHSSFHLKLGHQS